MSISTPARTPDRLWWPVVVDLGDAGPVADCVCAVDRDEAITVARGLWPSAIAVSVDELPREVDADVEVVSWWPVTLTFGPGHTRSSTAAIQGHTPLEALDAATCTWPAAVLISVGSEPLAGRS